MGVFPLISAGLRFQSVCVCADAHAHVGDVSACASAFVFTSPLACPLGRTCPCIGPSLCLCGLPVCLGLSVRLSSPVPSWVPASGVWKAPSPSFGFSFLSFPLSAHFDSIDLRGLILFPLCSRRSYFNFFRILNKRWGGGEGPTFLTRYGAGRAGQEQGIWKAPLAGRHQNHHSLAWVLQSSPCLGRGHGS